MHFVQCTLLKGSHYPIHSTLSLLVVLLLSINNLQCQKEPTDHLTPWYPAKNASGQSVIAVYENRIPCADCERTKVAVVLYGSSQPWQPQSYHLAQVFVGKSDDRLEKFGSLVQKTGTGLDPQATYLQFDEQAPPELKYFWVIGENLLFILDQHLMPQVGDASHGYVLNRTK